MSNEDIGFVIIYWKIRNNIYFCILDRCTVQILEISCIGMQSVKDMPVVQDGPPPGGFPAIRYGRRIPNTGPSGIALFTAGTIIMAYGFYRVGQGNRQRRSERREKMDARRTLVPFLQAEEDRRFVKEYAIFKEKESALLKDVRVSFLLNNLISGCMYYSFEITNMMQQGIRQRLSHIFFSCISSAVKRLQD